MQELWTCSWMFIIFVAFLSSILKSTSRNLTRKKLKTELLQEFAQEFPTCDRSRARYDVPIENKQLRSMFNISMAFNLLTVTDSANGL